MTTHKELAALLQTFEEQLLQPATRSNAKAVAELLAEDFREFGSSGRVYTRQQIIAELATESLRSISLRNFHCNLIAPDIALITYQSTSTSSEIEDKEVLLSLRSSLWRLRDGRWQMLFHQGTKIPSALSNAEA